MPIPPHTIFPIFCAGPSAAPDPIPPCLLVVGTPMTPYLLPQFVAQNSIEHQYGIPYLETLFVSYPSDMLPITFHNDAPFFPSIFPPGISCDVSGIISGTPTTVAFALQCHVSLHTQTPNAPGVHSPGLSLLVVLGGLGVAGGGNRSYPM